MRKIRLATWLTINRECNLRCEWCYARMTGFSAADTMSIGTADASLKAMRDIGAESVILIGGEPTIHPNFLEIVRLARLHGLKCYLVTNAIPFIDEDLLLRTIEAGVESITISFKSPNRQLFVRDTGADLYESQCRAVENIVKSGVHNVLNVTACDTLLENLDGMIATAEMLQVRSFAIDTGKPIFLNDQSCASGMGSPKRMVKFFIEANRKLLESQLRFSLKISIPFCLFPKDDIEQMLSEGNVIAGCQMHSGNGLIIDPQGRIIPCNHICNKFLGHIGEDGVTGLESYFAYRNGPEVERFFEIAASCPTKRCVDCGFWEKCGGGCKLYWMHYQPGELVGSFAPVVA